MIRSPSDTQTGKTPAVEELQTVIDQIGGAGPTLNAITRKDQRAAQTYRMTKL